MYKQLLLYSVILDWTSWALTYDLSILFPGWTRCHVANKQAQTETWNIIPESTVYTNIVGFFVCVYFFFTNSQQIHTHTHTILLVWLHVLQNQQTKQNVIGSVCKSVPSGTRWNRKRQIIVGKKQTLWGWILTEKTHCWQTYREFIWGFLCWGKIC